MSGLYVIGLLIIIVTFAILVSINTNFDPTSSANIVRDVFASTASQINSYSVSNAERNEKITLSFISSSNELKTLEGNAILNLTKNEELIKKIRNLTYNVFNDYGSDHRLLKSLCVITVHTLSAKSFEIVIDNIENEYISKLSFCDWGIFVLGSDSGKISNQKGDTEINMGQIVNNSLEKIQKIFAKVKYSDYKLIFTKHIDPKSPTASIFTEVLPYLVQNEKKYSSVWLLNEKTDISHFNIKKFIKLIKCSFFPEQPLIIQPLLKPKHIQYNKYTTTHSDSSSSSSSTDFSSSEYNFLLSSEWDKDTSKNNPITTEVDDVVVAVKTSSINMNAAPIIRTDFFIWFTQQVVETSLPAFEVLHTKYNYDHVICSAAESFANVANSFKTNNNPSTSSSSSSSLSSTRRLVSDVKYNKNGNLKKEKKSKKDKKDKKNKKNKDTTSTDYSTTSKSPASSPVLPTLTLTSCILAIYGSPVEYEDDEAESSKLKLPWKMTTDKATSHIIQELFPSWYISTAVTATSGLSGVSSIMNNPLYNETKFTRSSRINNFCLKY